MSEGRPAGHAAAGHYDNGVTPPGCRRAYGGDHESPGTADGVDEAEGAEVVVFPGRGDRIPLPDPHHRRELVAPVRIRCYRHEGIIVANHRRFPGLAGLTATWELAPADGPTLTAPAPLPDLRPGETAAVPLPFTLPKGGGEAWLTLRVVTAEDEPSAPRGTEVCAPRIRLRAVPTARPRTEGPAGAPRALRSVAT